MLITTASGLIDYDLELLVDVASVFDRQLEGIARKSTECEDPDAFGYFDRAEHITGLGFVACQAYMAATYGYLRIAKPFALTVGPRHASGRAVAELINHAANYWKHNSAWPLEKNERRQKQVIEAFDDIGFPVGTDYPLSGVLMELSAPHEPSFRTLATLLEAWRNELRAT